MLQDLDMLSPSRGIRTTYPSSLSSLLWLEALFISREHPYSKGPPLFLGDNPVLQGAICIPGVQPGRQKLTFWSFDPI